MDQLQQHPPLDNDQQKALLAVLGEVKSPMDRHVARCVRLGKGVFETLRVDGDRAVRCGSKAVPAMVDLMAVIVNFPEGEMIPGDWSAENLIFDGRRDVVVNINLRAMANGVHTTRLDVLASVCRQITEILKGGPREKYGYSFVKSDCGGMGAMIHDLMLAYNYARMNDLELCIIEEDMVPPRFNGFDAGQTKETLFSYLENPFAVVKRDEIGKTWRELKDGRGWKNHPQGADPREWYKGLLKEILALRPKVLAEVEEMIRLSGFNPATDVVMHVRRGDKTGQSGDVLADRRAESAVVPLEMYVAHALLAIDELRRRESGVTYRVFVCTDDLSIMAQLGKLLTGGAGVPVVHDPRQSNHNLQNARFAGTMTQTQAKRDNLESFKNFLIMSRGRHLVGARASYYFRIGELLRRDDGVSNVQDNFKFGAPPYNRSREIAVQYSRGHRLSDGWHRDLPAGLAEKMKQDRLVVVEDCLTPRAVEEITRAKGHFKDEWWQHIIVHKDQVYLAEEAPQLAEHHARAVEFRERGLFSYHFKTSMGRLMNPHHYESCPCLSCLLHNTVRNGEFFALASAIVGKPVVAITESFLSLYQRGHFLTMHHDKSKGHYAFVLSLTADWHPENGGATCFARGDAYGPSPEIWCRVVPRMGTLIIFDVHQLPQMDHYVEEVTAGDRLAYTGWFNVAHSAHIA